MIEKVTVKQRFNHANYANSSKFKRLAAGLKNKRVIHLNATAKGGGVAELMQSLIPHLRSLEIKADWYVINPKRAGSKFFNFTNRLHNALQGSLMKFSRQDWLVYEKVNRQIAADLDKLSPDLLVIHDPQPLTAASYVSWNGPKILTMHIDTSHPCRDAWDKMLSLIKNFDRIVFSNEKFINNHFPKSKLRIIPPAIDPYSPKQKIVPQAKARNYLSGFGIDKKKPLVVQVSRFDIWKNPLGVIEAFRLAQQTFPEVQLALVGFSESPDNPEAQIIYKNIAAVVKNDPQIFLFFDPRNIASVVEFTNMAQNAADIIVQNSIREGFGLTVTEAMWKEKAVIGGPASGIRLQIKDGETGFIAKNSEELAEKIAYLLKNPRKRKIIGKAAKKSVIKNFLFPRLVLDHLKLYNELL